MADDDFTLDLPRRGKGGGANKGQLDRALRGGVNAIGRATPDMNRREGARWFNRGRGPGTVKAKAAAPTRSQRVIVKALNTVDLRTASAAQLDDARTSLETLTTGSVASTGYGWGQEWLLQIGADQRRADHMMTHIVQNEDRLDTAIGSLTDADLGKASTDLRQAEARQQLALSTVRQALDAYGAYATGLLGNVQRTQRAVG